MSGWAWNSSRHYSPVILFCPLWSLGRLGGARNYPGVDGCTLEIVRFGMLSEQCLRDRS
jgi:hypothetical protein